MKFTGLRSRTAQGLILALGAPGGWLVIRLIAGGYLQVSDLDRRTVRPNRTFG